MKTIVVGSARFTLGSLACPSSLRGRSCLRRFGFVAFGEVLARLGRRLIPRDALHQMAIHRLRDQPLMHSARITAFGKRGKGPRTRCLAREQSATAAATQTGEPAVNLKTSPQLFCKRLLGKALVERRTSNQIASRAGTRLYSSVGIMRCFDAAHDTREGGADPTATAPNQAEEPRASAICKRHLLGVLHFRRRTSPQRSTNCRLLGAPQRLLTEEDLR